MKIFWLIVALLAAALAVTTFLPEATPPSAADSSPAANAVARSSPPVARVPEAAPEPEPPLVDTLVDLIDDLDSSAAARGADEGDVDETETPATPEWTELPALDLAEPVADDASAGDGPRDWTLKGAGTAEDPYRLTWDMLVSAQKDYRPRDGLNEIPPHILQLHNKYVAITGYIALPFVSGAVDELLVMLNQWDGCCIGIPPSVYDSVEVRLRDPVRVAAGHGRVAPYATVTGRMTIDPYIVRDWLVGLYLMEDATVDLGL